ncbi:ATP-binding protein [Streptomyces sp. SA15]|uniref:ATP-binding protein n=1 Tax=Streptomyces sp. SA15 TaxID=934019 RepID=UPI00117FB020|nr:ATP-binding protein [Streptomyces sp. SA15]
MLHLLALPKAVPEARRAVRAKDERGRGLLLLDAVAARWGMTQDRRGKTVWCEFRP